MTDDTFSDKNSLSGRLNRYTKVTTSMAGLGVKLAGERYLGLSLDKGSHAADLRAALGQLKGPLMKVAQILSTIPDAIPPEYVAELSQLQADAPSMGWPFVKRRMASELGADWQQRFAHFEQTACSAASLGQVHKATAHDGTRLACKLQYPDMASAVEADVKQLKLILSLFERYDRAVNTQDVQAEIAARLREELDYTREAKHIAAYQHMLRDTTGVHVPSVVPDLSTGRLLTMTWLDGNKLVDVAAQRDLASRNQIAVNMFKAWYVPFYYYGLIHGDPHLGNYTLREDNSLNLLDYGCVRVFKPRLVEGVMQLYNALRTKDTDACVNAYEAWGFVNPPKALIEILNIWAGFIYAPILEDKKRLIEETNNGLYGRETAARVHAELRKIGGVTIPREFVFMDRAAVGLGSVFLRLKAEINWYQMFQELVQHFNPATLATQQAALLKSCDLGDHDHG